MLVVVIGLKGPHNDRVHVCRVKADKGGSDRTILAESMPAAGYNRQGEKK
jgi:hypothetical protein